MNQLPEPHLYPLGDQGLCIDWGSRIEPALNARVMAFYQRMREARLPGVRDLVPAYSSLGVLFDAAWLLRQFPGQSPYALLKTQIEHLLESPQEVVAGGEGRIVPVPVCYDTSLAPDLLRLCRHAGLSPEAFVQRHTGRDYRVFMIGFLPGFAYLGALDKRIAAPRLAQPRVSVPAGSVGIAGRQTGIYPLASPGGWNLIGRTPLRLFDPLRADPVLLQPGDQVRFHAITLAEFREMSS